MSDNPIQDLVDDEPTPALIANPTSNTYDPTQDSSAPGALGAPISVVGLFHQGGILGGNAQGQQGLSTEYTATFTVPVGDATNQLPANFPVQAQFTTLTTVGVTFSIQSVRQRWFEGQVIGFTFSLIR